MQRLRHRRTTGLSIICAACLVLAGALSGHGVDSVSRSENPPKQLAPGDWVYVQGVAFSVPARGEGVWAEARVAGGESAAVEVETRPDGRVLLHDVSGSQQVGWAAATATTSTNDTSSKCKDRAHTLTSDPWASTYNWYFAAKTRPGNLGRYRTRKKLAAAAASITSGRNNCGLADRISAESSYRGTTSRRPNISSSAGCGRRDGRSVVGFGDLPRGYVGMTCWWTMDGVRVEADIKLNKYDYRWYNVRPSGCSYRWSVRAVATHEFGHVFGLGHVSKDDPLTMHPNIRPCQNSEATLGLGDVLGLRDLY